MDECAVHRWESVLLDRQTSGSALVIAVDNFICGIHCVPHTTAHAIGYKSVAVNLSDLAAMGATPQRGLVSLLLPPAEAGRASRICKGCDTIAATFGVHLEHTVFRAKTLALTVELHGNVDPAIALRRSAARIGDTIYVSGTLGDAAAGLSIVQGRLPASSSDEQQLRARLDYPEPRISLGHALRGIASSAIDLSDGLCQDLTHVLNASDVSARIAIDRIPLSGALIRTCGLATARHLALNAGDDYELCFTAPASQQAAIERIGAQPGCRLQAIGYIIARRQPLISDLNDTTIHSPRGFDHFQ